MRSTRILPMWAKGWAQEQKDKGDDGSSFIPSSFISTQKALETMEDLIEKVGIERSYVLRTGRLDLRFHGNQRDADLFQIAERQNPKRGFLFVSTVLGRHIPVVPSHHRKVLQTLGERCLPHLLAGSVLVMGFAETAVGLGAGVAEEISRHGWATSYLPTTRHAVTGRGWLSFSEEHSHASAHEVLRPGSNPNWDPSVDVVRNLILVDDEMTTGKTMTNLATALKGTGLAFARIVLVTLTDWSEGRAAAQVRAATCINDVRTVSLLEGGWSWTEERNAPLSTVPTLKGHALPTWHPTNDQGVFGAPRLGIAGFSGPGVLASLKLAPFIAGARVLVIGSGEHVWHPFRLAEELEAIGCLAAFCATTRSPINLGEAIRCTLTFPDHFGVGVPMYLHNVQRQDWDRVILMTETGIEGIDDHLAEQLSPCEIIDGQGQICTTGGLS